MDNKLQELTDKLYKEGLSKGKEEGEAILAKAQSKAAEIVEAAQKKAEEIIKKAENDAKDYQVKVEGDVKMAGKPLQHCLPPISSKRSSLTWRRTSTLRKVWTWNLLCRRI